MIGSQQLSDTDKQAWLKRMADEPGFRDALILESYITLKGLEAAAQTIAAQFSGGAAGKMLAMMGLGNGGEKAS